MYDFLNDHHVAIYNNEILKGYPQNSPYDPSTGYPEYQFGRNHISAEHNGVYDALRSLLHKLNMDIENYGTAGWNPFQEIIKPGNKVVIKPNFVLDRHLGGGTVDAVITHPSLIRAVIDYVYIALCGKGEIIIGDAPQADANFDNILDYTGLEEINNLYKDEKGFDISVMDFRQLKFVYKNDILTGESRIKLDGDPLGYTIFDLGSDSEFDELESFDKLYGADYDRRETKIHHRKGKHEYCIANTVLTADVVISIPKMKTHRKGGVTLNLKNIVGINGNKNYLPHFNIGTPEDGGDEYPQLEGQEKRALYTQRLLIDRLLARPNYLKETAYKLAVRFYRFLKPVFFRRVSTTQIQGGGGWYGNDTVWRMILDLNKILIYGNATGKMADTPQRKLFCVVDGIIAGEGDGPLMPQAKACGLVAAGVNFLLIDLLLIGMMGFDHNKIPLYRNSQQINRYKLTNVSSSDSKLCSNINGCALNIPFKAPPGWVGHMELEK